MEGRSSRSCSTYFLYWLGFSSSLKVLQPESDNNWLCWSVKVYLNQLFCYICQLNIGEHRINKYFEHGSSSLCRDKPPFLLFNYLVYCLDMAIVQDLVDKTVCNIYKWTLSGCHDLLQTVSFTIFLFLGQAMYLDAVFSILNILLLKKVKVVFLKVSFFLQCLVF